MSLKSSPIEHGRHKAVVVGVVALRTQVKDGALGEPRHEAALQQCVSALCPLSHARQQALVQEGQPNQHTTHSHVGD